MPLGCRDGRAIGNDSNPSAANKTTVSGPVSATGAFSSGKNGNVTASLTLSPPPPPASITLSATATATFACVNGGSNHPKATNKASTTGQVSNTGSFPVRNGQTTGTIAVGPPPAPAFSPPCSPPMTVVIAQVSYTNVVLTGLAGDTSAEPSLSACLFPGIGIC